MIKTASISTNIFDELFVTIESIGVDSTIKVLQEARTKVLILGDNNVDNIINAVVEITGVQKSRILHGTDRSDDRKMALALCVYYIKNKFEYSYNDMNKIFSKDRAGLYRYYSLIENITAKPKNEFDKTLSEYRKQLELFITREKIK
jgi:hypothetical protein